jgi:hypothetical protein
MNDRQHGETNMQRYDLATPRLAIGTAAVALAATTLAVLVIIPATMEVDARTLAAQAVATSVRDSAGGIVAEHQVAAAPCAVQARAGDGQRDSNDASL